MMRLRILILLLLTASYLPAQSIPQIVGTYSSLTYHAGEGDVTGLEVTILLSGYEGNYNYHVIVQQAEGEVAPPRYYIAKMDGSKLLAYDNTTPTDASLLFTATLVDTKMKITVNSVRKDIPLSDTTLPRKVSFWNPSPASLKSSLP